MLTSRRQWLQISAVGLAGSASWRPAAARAVDAARPIRACIFIFYQGGPSHLDTWDMKPQAPAEVRGPFAPIATSVPGLTICEHMPHLARVADKFAVIRSLRHQLTNHLPAAYTTLIGHEPLGGNQLFTFQRENDPPSLGSSVSLARPALQKGLPTFVALPYRMFNEVDVPGQSAGFLGPAYEPLQLESDPNQPDFALPELQLPEGVSVDRLAGRERLRERLQATFPSQVPDGFREQALEFLSSEATRVAFEIGRENAALRERYGRTRHGQSLLLARRLVEAGVPFVAVYDRKINGQESWDTHSQHFTLTKESLLPPAEQGLAALVDDLEDRGLLESTLVVAVGEFGRTPRINAAAGRDHWPFVYSGALAGGGAKGGFVFGASDSLGAAVDSHPISPNDLAASVLWRFGLDPASEHRDKLGRTYRLANGEPVRALFS